jgi:hypothetical protein
MTKEELNKLIKELGISKVKLAELLNYNKTYFTDLTKATNKKEIPKHIDIILQLLKFIKDNNLDFESYLVQLNIKKNEHKGGKF